MDGAVVINVDLGAGLCHDLLDHAAALADDLADLVRVNVQGDHLGSVLADLRPGLGNCRQHHLI